MNAWLSDARVEKGEAAAFRAEQSERQGNPASARTLYREAAEAFASVALSVPADHPNTRSDLAIAAVASFARSGDFGRALEFARRALAEVDALSEHGKAELSRIVDEYGALIVRAAPRKLASGRGLELREAVRSQFRPKAA